MLIGACTVNKVKYKTLWFTFPGNIIGNFRGPLCSSVSREIATQMEKKFCSFLNWKMWRKRKILENIFIRMQMNGSEWIQSMIIEVTHFSSWFSIFCFSMTCVHRKRFEFKFLKWTIQSVHHIKRSELRSEACDKN